MNIARFPILLCLMALLAPQRADAWQSNNRDVLTISRGEKGNYVLSGSTYANLTSVRVMLGKRQAAGVTATLSKQNRNGRTLSIVTTDQAEAGQDYSLQGLSGRKVVSLPLVLNITTDNSSQGQRGTNRNASKPNRGGRSSGNSNKKRAENTRRSSDDRSKKASEKKTQRGKNSESRGKESQKKTSARFEISPTGQRTVELNGTAYRSMKEVRVLLNRRPSNNVAAKVKRTKNGTAVELFASQKAKVANYVLQGKIGNRWVNLPIQMEVTSLPREINQGGDLVEYRHREVITLTDGTRVVIGGEKPTDGNDGEFVPTPVITSWSPTKFGNVGGSLSIQGTNLGTDLVVKVGDTTLEIIERSETQMTVRLPDNSDSCPPGALRVLRSSGSQIRSCEPHYFVRGDKPFHHLVDTSSHNYINSYLMARLSRWVYNDYHSVNTWNGFKDKFENKVTPLGITKTEFIKPGNGPGDTEVAIVANPAAIVIVFRGSESPVKEENGFKDWFHTNTDIDQKPVNSWQQGAWVHEGFYNAYDDVHSTLTNKLSSLRNNGQPIFITGHSLGGALATMAAYRLKKANFPIRGVYTYGSPRDGNSEWVKAYDNAQLFNRTQRWVNRQDFAPRFPPLAGWRHVGRTNNIHMNGSVQLDDNEISAVAFPNHIDHEMDTYCAEILQELSVTQKNKIQDASAN